MAGELACPPEDCGGIFSYYHMLEVFANKKHPEYEEMLEWMGGEIDPNEFDLDFVNEVLANYEDLDANFF